MNKKQNCIFFCHLNFKLKHTTPPNNQQQNSHFQVNSFKRLSENEVFSHASAHPHTTPSPPPPSPFQQQKQTTAAKQKKPLKSTPWKVYTYSYLDFISTFGLSTFVRWSLVSWQQAGRPRITAITGLWWLWAERCCMFRQWLCNTDCTFFHSDGICWAVDCKTWSEERFNLKARCFQAKAAF